MYWFPVYRNSHQCTLITIEKDSPRFRLVHSENFAGYDRVKDLVDIAECPVCGNKYDFNKRKRVEVVEQVSYKEINGKGK